MKTSAKLLAAVGLTAFVLPLSIAAYKVTQNRVPVEEYADMMHKEASSSEATDVYLKTTPLKAFHKIMLDGEGEGYVDLIVVKSDKYALKVDKNRAEAFQATVDAEGVLHISGSGKHDFYYTSFYVFMPETHAIHLNRLGASLSIDTDSLTIYADAVKEFRFSPNSKVQKLRVDMKNSTINFNKASREDHATLPRIADITLDLENTTFSIEKQQFDKLLINANSARVNFYNKGEDAYIKDLRLSTQGNTQIVLDSLPVRTVSGRLSEQTTIDLPISQLRKLIAVQ